MNSKVVCFFLILSVVFALTTADFEDDFFEELMEKRGRGGRGNGRGNGRGGKKAEYLPCPSNPRCYCPYDWRTGEYGKATTCIQSNAANIGI